MENQDLFQRVSKEIDKIRPYLQADGGNIQLMEVTPEKIVKVQLQGACGSCPMSKITLKNGVEAAVRKAIPEIVSVESV